MRLRASAAEERWMAFRRSARAWRKGGMLTAEQLAAVEARPVEWRTSSTLLRIVLFVLAAIGVFAVHELDMPAGILLIVAIGVAEVLIVGRRYCQSGVEEALWVAGLWAYIFSLESSTGLGPLVLAGAAIVAGWRTLSAPLLVVALPLAAFWLQDRYDAEFAVWGCCAIAAAAVFARRMTLRPYLDQALGAIAVAAPAVGYVAQFGGRELAILPLLLWAIAAVVLGIRWRSRATLGSAVVALVVYAVEISRRIDAPEEGKLLAAGIVLLAIAVVLERRLRESWRGFTSRRLAGDSLADLLPVVATPLVAHAAAPPAEDFRGGGGEYGGAGATGDWR